MAKVDELMEEYKFESIYRFVSIVSDAVDSGFDFWNFNGELFVQSALKFNKNSLLHIYASSALYCYYLRSFKKDGDCIEEEEIDWWRGIFEKYNVALVESNYDGEQDDASWEWFEKNEDSFLEFFDVVSDEIVHILFNDKQFLVKFNGLVRNVVADENKSYADIVHWPEGARNEDGSIKRCAIPRWVKRAVYHRDKGRCVFCNKDLTGIVNISTPKNFDHIIPLKEYGTNDPCNIQLTCEKCNKGKGGRSIVPAYRYQRWW